MQYLILGILFGSVTVIWSIPFLLLKLFGSSLFVIRDQKKVEKILKKIDNNITSTMYNYQYGEIKKSGLFFSKNSVGYLHEKKEEDQVVFDLYIIMSKKTFDIISKDDDNNDKISVIVDNKITMYDRDGTYWRLYYNKRSIAIGDIEPSIKQRIIIDKIKDFYLKNKFCVSFVQGLPGSGKTTIAYLLAKELNGTICKTFRPYEPNDTMSNLYERIQPNKESPLIILFDEANIMIRKIHDQTIIPHKNIPISVYDKSTFNSFLDDMKYNKNIIILMTSNETKDQIDLLDKSYLRDGRVNIFDNI